MNDEAWDALDELRFSTNDAEVILNATMILMTGAGRSKFDIAEDLGCSAVTVDNVRKRYRERALEGLQRRKPPGRTSRATLLGSAPQAHDERQTARVGLGAGPRRAENAEKNALRKNAGEVLIFQDEVEIHRHPALARVGKQPEVPAPGKAEKKVVYGGVDQLSVGSIPDSCKMKRNHYLFPLSVQNRLMATVGLVVLDILFDLGVQSVGVGLVFVLDRPNDPGLSRGESCECETQAKKKC